MVECTHLLCIELACHKCFFKQGHIGLSSKATRGQSICKLDSVAKAFMLLQAGDLLYEIVSLLNYFFSSISSHLVRVVVKSFMCNQE